MSIYTKIQKHGFIGSFRILMNVLCKPIRPIVYSFFRLLPIKHNLIILESEPDFSDNAWALYHFLRVQKKYHFAWAVINPKTYPADQDTVYFSRFGCGLRIRAYYYFSRAEFIVFTHCTLPEFIRNGRQQLIYTSHGCPLKAGKGNGKLTFDYTLSLGRCVATAQALFLQSKEETIIPLGYPRNDILLQNVGNGRENPFAKMGVRKLVLWMPTFRESVQKSLSEHQCDTNTGLPLFTSEAMILELNDFLQKIDMEILIKIHHLQANKDIFSHHFSNICFLTDEMIRQKGFQLYGIIGKSDALITDYSSVSFDYLLIDKPIGYILDDYDHYKSDRGFVWSDVKKLMPGHHLYQKSEFYAFLMDINEEKDGFKVRREETKRSIHDYLDDKSSKRFMNFFLNTSKKRTEYEQY